MPEGLERARKLPPAPRGQPFTERRSCGARRDDVFDLRRQAIRQAFGQLMARDWQGAFWLCCLYWEVAFVRNTSARQRIEEQLDGAERLQRCLVPKTRADREALRRAVAAGVAVRPFSGMFMRASTWDVLKTSPRVRWRYVQNTFLDEHPDETVCSFSAALDHGLWVSKKYLDTIHLVASGRSHGRCGTGIHRHECPLNEIELNGTVKRTTLERTVLDCSLVASFEDGLAIADSALRFCKLDIQKYRDYVEALARCRSGALCAEMVARYVDGASESGGESIVRGLIVALGYLPPTMLQAEFVDPIDGGAIRADMYYELPNGLRLIIEVDGFGKYVGADGLGKEMQRRLVAERQRESHITALGIPVMRVQFSRVYEDGYLEHLLRRFGVPKVAPHM